MQLQSRENTHPELALRRALHSAGFRFRVHRSIVPGVRRVVDIVFGPSKVAVFVDGCFWHGCPEHYRRPKVNGPYWNPKIARNAARDRDTDARLTEAGWQVIRIWEHEAVEDVVDRIANAVEKRRPVSRRRAANESRS
jgi:DNA mismatch endonuclease (patch repair protein)